jgi:FHA domain/Zinc-ribbon containing domain
VETVASGTIVGPGSFSCQRCEYSLTLTEPQELGACPRCGGRGFARASLFMAERARDEHATQRTGEAVLADDRRGAGAIDDQERLGRLREEIGLAGQYLCYEENGELLTVALKHEWTRVGRSLAADIRFDDPTVSRRHALIVREADGVRVLDDRSLNGVFVNGARVERMVLEDGDEITIGRHRLRFLDLAPGLAQAPGEARREDPAPTRAERGEGPSAAADAPPGP